MLEYSRGFTANILDGFECGIPAMDAFIHCDLESLLKGDSRFAFYVVKAAEKGIVAMYIISDGKLVDYDDEFHDIPAGKPWGYIDDNYDMHTGTAYPTMEIDYLAVRKDLRNNGIGRDIIKKLAAEAKQKDCFFLTVDAYHVREYSAVPFYEKQGFFPLHNYSDHYDTLRMAKRL